MQWLKNTKKRLNFCFLTVMSNKRHFVFFKWKHVYFYSGRDFFSDFNDALSLTILTLEDKMI
jgi:hypothetical protein